MQNASQKNSMCISWGYSPSSMTPPWNAAFPLLHGVLQWGQLCWGNPALQSHVQVLEVQEKSFYLLKLGNIFARAQSGSNHTEKEGKARITLGSVLIAMAEISKGILLSLALPY